MTESLEIKTEFNSKAIRSYVIRAGRMTEGQKNAFDRYWKTFGLSLHAGPIVPADVFAREAPLVVELGFGMGDSLYEMVKAEADKNFIGIEVHPPGVGRLINTAGKSELHNLKVYMADAVDVLTDCIPDESIDRFQLYFPDPWHKKKHHKRRIVQPEFIQLVARKMAPNGVLHMATDWQNYAEYMQEVMCDMPQFENVAGKNNYSERPAYRPITKFENRGARLGHGVWDLIFTKI